jgi:ArsR family transcriptional regulator
MPIRHAIKTNNPAQRIACLKALADENRLAIVDFLKDGERCVCEIWKKLDLPQNLVSHHLNVLKKAGLVVSEKKGLNVHYSINHACMKKLQQLLLPIMK